MKIIRPMIGDSIDYLEFFCILRNIVFIFRAIISSIPDQTDRFSQGTFSSKVRLNRAIKYYFD